MKISIFLSLFLITFSAFSQTTFVLPYSFGKLNPDSESLQLFQKGFKKLDLKNVDSVHFIGNSDSVGTFLSNFRTTELRAIKLKKYIAGSIKGNVPYLISPTGGDWEKAKGSTRQLNVVIYISETIKPKKNDAEIPQGCYKVAYSEMQNYHRETTSRGKTSYTQLDRSLTKSNAPREELYYGTLNAKGDFEAIRLKWKVEKVGKSWWAEEREVTEIPTDDFDRFKLFTIENKPCNSCHEDFSENKEIQKTELQLGLDLLVLENIQHKVPFFQRNKINVRVPQDFIDLNSDYYSHGNESTKIIWEEKDKEYYYAKVKQFSGEVSSIQRKFPTHSSADCQEELNNLDKVPQLISGPTRAKVETYNFAEMGIHFQNGTNIPYASLGLFTATRFVELDFLVGVHGKSALYAAIRGRYNILTVPFNSLFTGEKWRQSLTKNRFWYTRLYVGAEYKASIGRYSDDYLEPNIHAGLTFAKNNGSISHRLFVQYGYGVNFILESPRPFYSMTQVGVQLQLGKKAYRFEKGIM
jgi:hypothetical protein